ncbi:single-stranded-DNA-specific exonuclease RecJ [Desulfatitalea alkaliphila]|uniref:Single-stranded-DNA-specific exonuclease RecJ n=1 Tax=Desulfatitalea alkaliphila TaxID=2929485 RepID=A0AA41UJB6_9BACT|nr:single-stranded-DNA-specific exonuclease RecJ [Desulfatitalea alkaliphila]MCJ8501720.1 single-stranded-DNA-specific exonuclease RecJ [Desulfatitalea alkaliphila]
MQTQWTLLQPDKDLVREIQQQLQCHPVTAAVLANRQIRSAEEAADFIKPDLGQLPPPACLTGMAEAVARIAEAIAHRERILVFGDYDADGITAAAVLHHFLQAAGADVICHLPHRIQEGYGLQTMHIMQLAVPRHVQLIVTVDCGSAGADAVATAKRFGIDVVVTDHHNTDGCLPGACAFINPKRETAPGPLNDLAGVGVAFYLVIALRAALREQGWWQQRPEPNLKGYCDLVAIGTVADMVSLRGVNRLLTRVGLEVINTGARPGIQALITAAGIRQLPITADDIAFRLAPRINAAGRIAHAHLAFDLLAAPTLAAAQPLAQDLDGLNQRRQQMENKILAEIDGRLANRPEWVTARKTLLLAGTQWHEGVLGIVAAKLVNRYHRPVVVLSARDDQAKGSGRSIPQVDLHHALACCDHLLEKFGGHRLAAGLTVATENITLLQAAFEAAVAEQLPAHDPAPELRIDSLITLDQISPQLLDELESLAPFGTDNPSPLFMARDVRVTTAAIVGQRHRRMVLCQPDQCTPPIGAMHFNITSDTPRAQSFEQLAFRLQWNRFRGAKEIQMIVEGF